MFKFQVIQTEKRDGSDHLCFRSEKKLFVCSTILHIVDLIEFQFIQTEKWNRSDQYCFRTKNTLLVCFTILHIVDLFASCLSFKSLKLKN